MSEAFFNEMTEEELAEYARVYGDNDDESVPRSEISWVYDPDFDVSRLLSIMSAEEWKTWIEDEIQMATEEYDDPDRWGQLLEQDIIEPTVFFDHPDGTLRIWDGWHRSASTVVKGEKTMKVVYGTAPGYTPLPR